MRTLRMSLVGTLTVALLGGLSGTVAAQESEAEPVEATGVVITMAPTGIESDGEYTRGMPFSTYTGVDHRSSWEATDPRLSGEVTYRGTWHDYETPSYVQLEAFELTVVNDEGNWTGTGYGIYSLANRYGDMATVVIHGSGAYEGLTAFLTMDIADEWATIRGAIVADGMPPFPAPAE